MHKPTKAWLTILALTFGTIFAIQRRRSGCAKVVDRGSTLAPSTDAAALAQFHAAEYASERNSVDVWKTLQYALVPIMFGSWLLLAQVQKTLPKTVFDWACALVLPLCYVAYQKAMVDALTGVLLIEERVRPLATKLAGTDKFWFHEPTFRKDVPTDLAYAWFWPPLLSFASPLVMAAYRIATSSRFSWQDALGYVICSTIAYGVGALSKQGLALNKQIDRAIRQNRLSWSRNTA